MEERKKLAGLAILLVMILLLQSLLFRVTNIYYIFPLLDLIIDKIDFFVILIPFKYLLILLFA